MYVCVYIYMYLYIYIRITGSLCYTAELRQIVNQPYFIKIKKILKEELLINIPNKSYKPVKGNS